MLDVEGNTPAGYSLAPPLATNGRWWHATHNSSCSSLDQFVPDPDFQIDERIVRKIISATRSYDTHKRTTATLTFLKLCRCGFHTVSFEELT